jgi:hypothetical protein
MGVDVKHYVVCGVKLDYDVYGEIFDWFDENELYNEIDTLEKFAVSDAMSGKYSIFGEVIVECDEAYGIEMTIIEESNIEEYKKNYLKSLNILLGKYKLIKDLIKTLEPMEFKFIVFTHYS